MSLWESVQSFFGVGRPKLYVSLLETRGYRESALSGNAAIIGGEYAQRIETLLAELIEINENSSSSRKVLSSEIIATSLLIAPHACEDIPFVLKVPLEATLTGRQGAKTYLRLEAKLWSVFPLECRDQVLILPQKEIVAVRDGLIALGFTSSEGLMSLFQTKADNVSHFAPPSGLREAIAGVTLHVELSPNYASGRIVFNLKQPSLVEQIKAVVAGQQSVEFSWTFPREGLVGADGKPTPRTPYLRFKELVEKAAEKPDPNSRILLRPASAPETPSDELLRPAEGTLETRPEELLHPLDAPHAKPGNGAN